MGSKILTDAEIENNNASGVRLKFLSFYFLNQIYYCYDILDLQQQIVDELLGTVVTNERLLLVVGSRISWYDEGYYRYKIKYLLPGLNKASSEINFQLRYYK